MVTEIGRDGIIETDDDNKIIFVSPSMEWLWGYKSGEMVGKDAVLIRWITQLFPDSYYKIIKLIMPTKEDES